MVKILKKVRIGNTIRKHHILLFSLIALLLINCDNKPQMKAQLVSNSSIIVIKPNSDYDQLDISSILDTVKFVKLELNKESIIGGINKLIVFEDRIYILDNQTSSLFVFNIDGKFISKISKIGHGPGEYTALDFFDIDYEKRQIVLTDLMEYWISRYDLEGNYVSREKIPFWVEGVTPIFNQGYVVYANHRDNKHKLSQEYNLFYLDSSMQISKAYFPYNSSNFNNPKISFITPETGSFYTYNKNRCFFSHYKDQVYEITKEGLKPKYRFDFGEKTFNEKYLEQKTELKNYMEKGEFFQLANVLENDDFVIFSFYQTSTPIRHLGYYSKNSHKIICSPGFTVKDNYFDGHDMTTYNSWIIAAIQPSYLLSWSANVDNKKALLNSEYAQLKKNIADQLTQEDNPVLMFYKLKL